MYILQLVLNKKEYLNKVLEAFHKAGISGATILESKGMGSSFLECESPVVGGLRSLIYNECRPNNSTIFSVVESVEKAEEVIAETEKIVGSLEEEGAGIAFILPVEKVKGLKRTSPG